MSKYIDIYDKTTDRKVSLVIEPDGTLTLLGGLKHGSNLDIDINNLSLLVAWATAKHDESVKVVNSLKGGQNA